MKFTTPDTRLCLAAGFVRQDAIFADIGTDHAYLPAFLLSTGKISRAVCTDIAPSPLESARHNLTACGLIDRVSLVLTNGLEGLETYRLTDIAICGMGGELIARILKSAPFVQRDGVRLILQPMTRPSATRACLSDLGFDITAEGYCVAAGRTYVTICADYHGEVSPPGTAELELGDPGKVTVGRELYVPYAMRKIGAARKRIIDREGAGLDASADRAFVMSAEALVKEMEKIK